VGQIHFTSSLVPRGPAAAIVLDEEQVATVGEGAKLTNALAADPQARAAFDGLAFTHRKEYARWIQEAKREETRDRRVAQALEMIRAGRTRS
jgi:uncharacterized protein YdeI (YjbR/CyaY-like superfamily)